jgi:hypothetical protein
MINLAARTKLPKFLFLITLVLFSGISFAGNPQILACRINNSQFWTLNITEPKVDNVGFCRNDQSLIGSISVMQYSNTQTETDAVIAFKNTKSQSVASCGQVAAEQIVAIESQTGKAWDLCVFSDYSFISLRTLATGWFSSQNSNLKEILSK